VSKVKIVVDCATQVVSYVPLSAAEIAELEATMSSPQAIQEPDEEIAAITE
jgi:hypothetical protein